MCGRARCTLNPEDVSAACGFQAPLATRNAERFRPSYNVSPGSYMPIVRYRQEEDNKCPIVHYMKWGLVPSFTKKSEQPDFFRMFNARSESVHEKASFRRLLPKSRCLVTVEGFYEWKKDGSRKQPYYIHFSDHRPLVFAALFDCWTDSQGEVLYTFTILTTRSSKALEWLHDRMPVILGSKEAINRWLHDEISVQSLKAVSQPYESQDLVWYPVTPAMGKTQFDGPECVKEFKTGSETRRTIGQLFNKQKTSIQPHSGNAKVEEPAEVCHAKVLDESMMDEKELKAFLAAVKPDEDTKKPQKVDCKVEKENTDHVGSLMPDHKVYYDIPEEILSDKGRKRESSEPSPNLKAKKVATPGMKQGQRSLLNFFGKE